MNQGLSILSLVFLLLPLIWQLRRNYLKGLAYAVFLCVSMSTFQRIPLPGGLPQLTIFRLVLIIIFFAWLKQRRMGLISSGLPCSGYFWFWGLANLISLLLTTVDFVNSLKRYLDFVLEIWGFYLIVTTSLQSREDARQILRAAVAGIALVAVLAFIERYTAFNPVHFILTEGDGEEGVMRGRDVVATYQHRILLGTGMAMGLPLAFVLASQAAQQRQKLYLWSAVLLLLASCYFSQSRGPWIGAAIAVGVLMVLGTRKLRRGLLLIGGLSVLLLLARPGVYTTLFMSAKITTDTDSFKGGTFMYRLELWKVAWSQVIKSPARFLFGYGPGCGVDNEIDWELSYRGKSMEIWSWDNHYAYELFQSGVLGLLARLALYLAVARGVYRLYKQSTGEDKETLAAVFASAAVLIFMMSNVLIFSKQVNFLFWALAAVGFAFRLPEREPAPERAGEQSEILAPGTVVLGNP